MGTLIKDDSTTTINTTMAIVTPKTTNDV